MALFPLRQTGSALPPRPWGLRASLALLVAACLLPGALISSYFIVEGYLSQRDQARRSMIGSAQTLASALDRELASIESGLRVLAEATTLQRQDLAEFHARARGAQPLQLVSHYVLIDAQGQQQLNTLQPWGTPLPRDGGPASLRQVFRQDQAVVSDLFTGAVSQRPVLVMAVPVRVHGQVSYSLNAVIFLDRMSQLMADQHLPATWLGVILDSQGQIVARTHDPQRYVGQHASPSLLTAIQAQGQEGTVDSTSLDGTPLLTAFSPSHRSGWTVIVAIPRAEVSAGITQAGGLLLGINLLVFAGAWWFAWRLALTRVVLPIDQLTQRMHSISQGHDLGRPDAGPSGASRELLALGEGFEDMRLRLKQRDAERQTLLDQLATTLESMSDGFYTLDSHWRFTHVNRQVEQLLGRSRAQLIGQDHWSILPDREMQALRKSYERALRTQQPVQLEGRLPSLDLWLELNVYPSPQGLTVYFRDITALIKAHEATAAQLAAEAGNRAKSEFLSRMSHELRTPLNAVLGFAQVLRLDPHEPLHARQRQMVDLIESSGQHLLAMISEVLDLSRVEAGALELQPEPLDTRTLADSCVQMLQSAAQSAQVTLQVELDDAPATVFADRTRLKQVLLNLLSNAIKYNRPGGQATLTICQAGPQVHFAVRDTGIGLSEAQVSQLFQPFNRLGREQSRTPGTGIGLVISHRLVTLMGGSLQAQAHEGAGCTFSFSIPAA